MKVAPGAIAYLRRFAILPAHVTPTGSFGHIVKGDVLNHIKKLNLVPVDLTKVIHDVPKKSEPAAVAQTAKHVEVSKKPEPVAQPKKEDPKPATTAKPAAKQAAKSSAASPAYDPNKPFQQTWTDS